MKKNILHRSLACEGGDAPIDINNYLTIEALEDDLTVSLSINACEYCIDGNGNWKSLSANSVTDSVNMGQTLSFRGKLNPKSSTGIGTFTISKKCNLIGNCMSLLFKDSANENNSLLNFKYAFFKLFSNCTNIITVSENFLPATTLKENCYASMFQGCTSLTIAPKLPATTLHEYCYSGMFSNCTSLTTAPELPATTIKKYSYNSMFYGCKSLTEMPELPATTVSESSCKSMFQNCTSLITAYELPATTLDTECYANMFQGCTSLTTAPKLPSMNLAWMCYYYMFNNCTALITPPELPASTLTGYCYAYMFYNCTSLTTAPTLPALILEQYCYYNMFKNCSNLNYIKILAEDVSAYECLTSWVYRVATNGTFVKKPNVTISKGSDGIPLKWTVEDYVNEENGVE